MYKLIVADDEYIVHQFIEYVIKKYHLPFEICGTAKSGEETLALVKKCAPDFIILDINMPEINGLEVAKEIRKINTDIIIYILTAYKEFDYIHTAMHVDVNDYLVKPIRPLELVKILKKGITIVLKKRIEQSKKKRVEQQLQEKSAIVMNRQLLELLRNGAEEKAVYNLFYKISHKKNFSPIAIIGVEPWNKEGTNKFNDIKDLKLSILKKYGIILMDEYRIFIFSERWNLDILKTLNDSLIKDEKTYDIHFCTAVIFIDKNKSIFDSYHQLQDRIDFNLFWRKPHNLSYLSKSEQKDKEIAFDSIFRLIDKAVKEYDVIQANNIVKQLFNEMEDLEYKPGLAKLIIIRLGSALIDGYGEYIEDNEKISYRKRFVYRINEANFVEVLFDEIYIIINSIISKLSMTQNNAEQIVGLAMTYINNNYRNNITLEGVAKKYFVSSAYLSRIFKKYVGKRFVEYLTEVRMKEAKILLEKDKFTVTEIAHQVGFNDTSYFSTVFKKYYTCTPSELINLKKRDRK